MLGRSSAAIQRDRLGAVRALSETFAGAWVVLKGHHTLIGRREGPVFINPTGNPGLAQGGSGDVLAGYLTGCLARPALAAFSNPRLEALDIEGFFGVCGQPSLLCLPLSPGPLRPARRC